MAANPSIKRTRKQAITYAYESVSHWDKQKQQSRAKRKCIGRVDPQNPQDCSDPEKKGTDSRAER